MTRPPFRLATAAAFIAISAAAAPPARAQRVTPAVPQALVEGVGVRVVQQGTQGAVDESALRFFVSRGDSAAADAEVARLRRESPGWQPPEDLLATGIAARVDERPLWALYEARDLAGVRQAIAGLEAANAGWSPPAKLVQLLQAQEARADIEAKAAAKDWAGVVATAGRNPGQLTCENVDQMWTLAEAQVRSGDRSAAQGTYRRVIEGCPDADARFATLQKAKALLPREPLVELAKLEEGRAQDPAGTRRVAALLAPPAPARPIVPPALAALYRKGAGPGEARAAESAALARKDGAAARKIGWIRYEAQDLPGAAAWFERALAWGRSEDAARGMALALAGQGLWPELDELARRYPGQALAIAEETRGGRVGKALEAKDYATVLTGTGGATRPDALTARGWALLALDRPSEASVAFTAATNAADVTAAQAGDASYGLARSHLATGMLAEAAALAEGSTMPPERRSELKSEILGAQAVAAFGQKRYPRALALLEERARVAPLDRALGVIEGWTRYNMGQIRVAKRIFADLDRTYSTSETRKALKVIDEREGPSLGG